MVLATAVPWDKSIDDNLQNTTSLEVNLNILVERKALKNMCTEESLTSRRVTVDVKSVSMGHFLFSSISVSSLWNQSLSYLQSPGPANTIF